MTSNLVHILKEHGNDICAFKLFMDENFIVTSYSGTSSLFYSCFNTAFWLIMKKWIKYVNIRSVIQSSFLEGNKWRKFMRGLRLHWVTHAFPMRLWDFGLTIKWGRINIEDAPCLGTPKLVVMPENTDKSLWLTGEWEWVNRGHNYLNGLSKFHFA